MNEKNKLGRPTAIILADHALSNDLKTVFGEVEVASLMVAGYTILDHQLMELRDLGFEQCIILAKKNAKNLQAKFGKSERWGMTISVMDFALTKDQVLREYKSLSEPNGLLVFEMDRVRGHSVERILEMAAKSEYSLLEGVVNNKKIGITYLKHTESDFIINAQPLDLKSLSLNEMTNCRDFHKANFEIVNGVYEGLTPSVQCNLESGLRLHWASRVHKQSKLSASGNMVERRCQIGNLAELDSVILNHDVLVQGRAKLRNTIVMPNSIVMQ